MSGLYFLPRQEWSLDQGSEALQCYEEKQQAIYIQQVFLHASSFHLSVCARGDKARTAAALIVNWIKLKKDLFQRAKKKTKNRQRQRVCSRREERSDSEVTDKNLILFSMADCIGKKPKMLGLRHSNAASVTNIKAWKYIASSDLITYVTIKAESLEESKILRPEKGKGDIWDDGS